MAEFTPSKKTAQDFNNGIEYIDGQGNETGDVVSAETINNLVESALYTQEQADNAVASANSVVSLATNQPNVSEAGNVGVPAVSIEDIEGVGKRLKFSNLKGEEGITPNISMSVTVGNTVGTPRVTVVKGGTAENPTFALIFDNLKGATGATGASSINSALVTNVDGDSEVNTFSQQYIKGVAQAKNYYNLGARDYFEESGNKKTRIFRKTRTIILNGSEKWVLQSTVNGNFRYLLPFYVYGLTQKQENTGDLYFKSTYEIGTAQETWSAVKDCVALEKNTNDKPYNVVIFMQQYNNNTSLEEFKLYLSANPIVLQYEIENLYEEAMLKDYPVHIFSLDGEVSLNEEYLKTLNLFPYSNVLVTANNESWKLVEKQVYNIEANQLYAMSYKSSGSLKNENYIVVKDNNDTILFEGNGTVFSFMTQENSEYLKIFFAASTETAINNTESYGEIMLVKGGNHLPYASYNGAIIHENRVPLYQSTSSTSPAETIGGDWESLGSFASGSNVIYVWRKL